MCIKQKKSFMLKGSIECPFVSPDHPLFPNWCMKYIGGSG